MTSCCVGRAAVAPWSGKLIALAWSWNASVTSRRKLSTSVAVKVGEDGTFDILDSSKRRQRQQRRPVLGAVLGAEPFGGVSGFLRARGRVDAELIHLVHVIGELGESATLDDSRAAFRSRPDRLPPCRAEGVHFRISRSGALSASDGADAAHHQFFVARRVLM